MSSALGRQVLHNWLKTPGGQGRMMTPETSGGHGASLAESTGDLEALRALRWLAL